MKSSHKIKNQTSASNLNFSPNKGLQDNLKFQSNLNLQQITIDSRILPLFRSPLVLAKKEELKYKTNQLNIPRSLSKVLSNKNNIIKNKQITNQILKFYLKGITNYNLNLKSFILQENKLNLILNIKNDKLYKLNTKISNFIKQVNKLIFEVKNNTVLFKVIKNRKSFNKKSDTLFIKNDLQEMYEKKIFKNKIKNKKNKKNKGYQLQFRKVIFIHKISTEQINKNKDKNKELIEFGKEIINDLDYHISQNINLINKIQNHKKVFNLLRYLSLFNAEFNSSLNYKNINSKEKDSVKFNTSSTIENPNYASLVKYYKQILITQMFNLVNKSNLIQIEHTIKSIITNQEFDYKTDSISIKSNPISLVYNKNGLKDNNSSKYPIISKYLQAMSKYNLTNKNISIYYSNIIGFKFNSDTNKLFKNIYKLLAYSFKSMYCLISKPVFVFTADKIIIQFFYYLFIPNILKAKKIYKFSKNKRRKNLRIYLTWKKRRNKIKRLYRKIRKININTRIKLRKLYLYNITKIFPNKFKILCEILSNLFKKSVEFNLIRLHYPYNDSNILANLLAIFINRIKLRIIAKRLFGKAVLKKNNKLSSTKTNKLNIIPAFLSGINIKVAGRLLNNKIVPRKTVKTIRRGAVSKGKINYLDVSRYTNKNKRGAYSITVSSGQNFF